MKPGPTLGASLNHRLEPRYGRRKGGPWRPRQASARVTSGLPRKTIIAATQAGTVEHMCTCTVLLQLKMHGVVELLWLKGDSRVLVCLTYPH